MKLRKSFCCGLMTLIAAMVVTAMAFADGRAAQAAPLRADLSPTNVTSSGKFKVTISNPETERGEAKLLALRAEVKSTGVSKVVFEVSKDAKFAFSTTESQYPYCLFGDENNRCKYLLAGDEAKDKYVLKTGNYSVKVMVFGSGTAPEWSGIVKFTLANGDLTSPDLPYGTGSGNNPEVKIIDPYWRAEGMKKIQVEARLLNGGKGKQVESVEYRVYRLEPYEQVYAGVELGAPYCIFGELSDGKTCKSLKVGDMWPQSQLRVDQDNGFTKQNDESIPRTKIVPGEYELNIFVSTTFGTWSSQGNFTLLQ